jgi:Mg-chelatase subunit ChlD
VGVMLNMFEMQRYIAATAKRADLKVVWEEVNMPRTDRNTMYLPKIRARTTLEEYQMLRHAVTHEVDHQLFSDFKLLNEKKVGATNSLLGLIWNMLEDHRIEFLGTLDYEGDRLCSNDVYVRLVSQLLSAPIAKSEMAVPVMPLYAWLNPITADFYPNAHSVQTKIEATVPKEGQVYLDKLQAGDYAEVLRDIRTIDNRKAGTKATFDLACRIFEEVFEQNAEDEVKRCQEEAKNKGKKGKGGSPSKDGELGDGGGKEQGEDGGGKEGEQEGKAKGSKKGDGKPDGDAEGKQKIFANNYKDLVVDAHEPTGLHSEGMEIDYGKYSMHGDYTPPPASEFKEIDLTNRALSTNDYSHSIGEALAETSPAFAHKVRSILQIRARDNYQYGTKQGKLHQGALHKLCVKNAPAGYQQRVFKKRQVNDVLDAAITLLVDSSGSMNGSKYDHASAAAIMMSEVMGNQLHVPVEIIGFTDRGAPTMLVHRKFSDKLVQKDDLLKRFGYGGDMLCHNGDGDAVMFAFDRLMKRKEKKKLLLVFSDGQPAGWSGYGDGVWHLKHVVNKIETESPVDIMGIGLESDSVRMFYKQNCVINNADQIEEALLTIIEDKLQ